MAKPSYSFLAGAGQFWSAYNLRHEVTVNPSFPVTNHIAPSPYPHYLLSGGLKGERAKRFSRRRKTSRIIGYFSSNKIQICFTNYTSESVTIASTRNFIFKLIWRLTFQFLNDLAYWKHLSFIVAFLFFIQSKKIYIWSTTIQIYFMTFVMQ